jgi:hypothetical protein
LEDHGILPLCADRLGQCQLFLVLLGGQLGLGYVHVEVFIPPFALVVDVNVERDFVRFFPCAVSGELQYISFFTTKQQQNCQRNKWASEKCILNAMSNCEFWKGKKN